MVGYLRREGLGDRTIHNRVGEVVTFLRHFGIKDVTIRVKFVEQKVGAYRPDELKSLFAAADPVVERCTSKCDHAIYVFSCFLSDCFCEE